MSPNGEPQGGITNRVWIDPGHDADHFAIFAPTSEVEHQPTPCLSAHNFRFGTSVSGPQRSIRAFEGIKPTAANHGQPHGLFTGNYPARGQGVRRVTLENLVRASDN